MHLDFITVYFARHKLKKHWSISSLDAGSVNGTGDCHIRF
jgi:hypothetical protein